MVAKRARTPSKKHPLFPVKSSNDRHPFFDLDAFGLPKILKTSRISREILNERHPRRMMRSIRRHRPTPAGSPTSRLPIKVANARATPILKLRYFEGLYFKVANPSRLAMATLIRLPPAPNLVTAKTRRPGSDQNVDAVRPKAMETP